MTTALRAAAAPHRKARRSLSLETLESRLNLSTLIAVAPPVALGVAAAAADTSTANTHRYRLDAWSDGQSGGQYGQTYINTNYAEAQQFFNRFKNRFSPFVSPTPTPPPPTVTPDPAPTPPPAPAPGDPIAISQTSLGNTLRLTLTGTTGNDSILVTQSGNTLTITANGNTSTVTGTFGELAVYGGAGNDTITIDSSVNIAGLLYGGSGTNTLVAHGSAKSYIVAIGAGTDALTGNGVNTSFWADAGDTVNASSAEIANGDVHRVSAFYQPFTTTPGAAGYVNTSLDGPNLLDPTDSGATTRLAASLWGSGPTMTDMNQGQVGDCYFLSALQSMAFATPGKLQEIAVDLGDGTYAVQFKRAGVTTFVRVDGDLPAAGWGGLLYAHPTSGGPIWQAIIEKAYAYYRTNSNTYNSLNWGWTGSAFGDLGVFTSTFSATSASVFNTLATAIAAGKPTAAITNTTITGGASVIGSHAYTVVATSTVSGVQWITLRNPWGFDGIGNDGNASDGIVKVTLAQFMANFSAGSIAM